MPVRSPSCNPACLQTMGIPFEVQGNLTGSLAAMQEVLFILLLGVIGAISDRVGRKAVYVFGLLTTSIGFALYPHSRQHPRTRRIPGHRRGRQCGHARHDGYCHRRLLDQSDTWQGQWHPGLHRDDRRLHTSHAGWSACPVRGTAVFPRPTRNKPPSPSRPRWGSLRLS